MKKFIILFCLAILLFHLFQIIYSQRSLFIQNYDVSYWKDRYEHSQYQLPLSKRTIGDDGLHAYAGYRLIKGDSPFSINNDKPPAGKYFLGLSILMFQNPLYVILLFGLCTLVVFYFIARRLLGDIVPALFATTILLLDPLFFSQFWITGLDLIQLFFLLLSILLIVSVNESRRWNIRVVLGAGLSLGLFMEIKPPILLPIIFILETVFLLQKGLKREYLFFILGLFLGIIVPYIRFIYLGHGIIDILRVHKFMFAIYMQSQLKVHFGAIWSTLMIGKFPNIISGSLINVTEWSILWPIFSSLGIIMALLSFCAKKVSILNKGVAVFLLTSLIIFTLIPSYPRYLVIVFPFIYFFGVSFLEKYLKTGRSFLYLIFLVFGVANSFFFLLPKSDTSLNGFYYNLSHLYFHDIYQENIADSNSLGLTRGEFRYVTNKALEDAGVKMIDVRELSKNISIFSTNGSVKIGLTYKTQDLGAFYEEKTIKLVQTNGIWKVKWDWNIVLNGFLPGYKIESQIILGKRGSIVNSDGVFLAKDMNGYLLSVNPEKIDLKREQLMLKTLPNYGYRGDVNFQNAYLENVLPGSYMPLLTLGQNISQKEKDKILSYPGIILTPYDTRLFFGIDPKTIDNTLYKECCTRIYSSYNYHGLKGPEKEYDKILWGYSGGKIVIKDDKEAIIKVVFEKNKKDGKDIVLNQ